MDCLALPAFTLKMKGTSHFWSKILSTGPAGSNISNCGIWAGFWWQSIPHEFVNGDHDPVSCIGTCSKQCTQEPFVRSCCIPPSWSPLCSWHVPYRNQKCGCPSEVHPYHVDPCRTRASRGRNEHCFHTPHLSPPGGALPVSSGSSWSSDVGRILPGEEHDFLCDIYDSLFSVLDLHGFSDIFRYDPILMVFMLGFLHQTVHRWQQHDSHAISSATRVLWTLHYTTFRIMVEMDLL